MQTEERLRPDIQDHDCAEPNIEKILSLNHLELIELWKRSFGRGNYPKESLSSFCKRYKVNETTFHHFIHGRTKTPHTESIMAMQQYLSKDRLVHPERERVMDRFVIHCEQAMYERVVHHGASIIMDDKGNKVPPLLKKIVFIDGDNAIQCLDDILLLSMDLKRRKRQKSGPTKKDDGELEKLKRVVAVAVDSDEEHICKQQQQQQQLYIENVKNEKDNTYDGDDDDEDDGDVMNEFHFVCVIAKDFTSSRFFNFYQKPWFSIVQSKTKVKNAVDFALTLHASVLCQKLESNKDIEFYFVSNDSFVKELALHLRESFGRTCHKVRSLARINRLTDILLSNDPARLIKDIKTEEKEREKEKNRDVWEKQEQQQRIHFGVEVNEHTPDADLISLYRHHWSSSQSQFCNRYHIAKSNFSSWLNGKRRSPASRRAVIQYLTELLNAQNESSDN